MFKINCISEKFKNNERSCVIRYLQGERPLGRGTGLPPSTEPSERDLLNGFTVE